MTGGYIFIDMHRCLQVPEIRLHVFEYFNYTDDKDEYEICHLPSLAALARTCKQFQDPALRLLWERTDDLWPLLRVMPEDLWNPWESQEDDQLQLQRDLTENDWDRFQYYGSMIRHLCLKTDAEFRATEQILARFAAYPRSERTILPRLDVLSLILDEGSVENVSCLLGFSLRRLFVMIEDHAPVGMDKILTAVAEKCPNIIYVHIPGIANIISFTGFSFTRCLSSFRQLRSLELGLGDLTLDLMDCLPQFENLKAISFGSDEDSQSALAGRNLSPRAAPAPFSPNFSGIQELSLHNCCIADLNILLGSIPQITHELSIAEVEGNVSLSELMKPLDRFANLQVILLDFDNISYSPPPSSPEELSPLMNLHNLRIVTLYGLPNHIVDNTWLNGISTTWPCLEVLELYPRESSRITLEGLIPISRNCKKLVELRITATCRPFNVHQLDSMSVICPLRHLEFRSAPLEQPWGVLRCISLLFPRLTWATGYHMVTKENSRDDPWTELNKAFKQAFIP